MPDNSAQSARHGVSWHGRLPFFYGWVIVGLAFVTMAIGVNARTSFSLLFPPITDEYGWPRAHVSAIFSIGFFASALFSPFIGWMMDKLGPRAVLPFGALLVGGGLYLTSISDTLWQLYMTLGVLVVGGSVFIAYIGHSAYVPQWFEKKRGLAIGIAFSGVGLVSVVFMPWIQSIIDTEGWRTACQVIAVLVLVVVVPLNLLLPRAKPSDLGLEPDGTRSDPTGDQPVSRSARGPSLGEALRSAPFWWLFICFISGLYAWYAIQVHQTKYLIDIGISSDLAAFALGAVGLAGIVGQIAVGYISDRIGREKAWSVAVGGFVATCALLLIMKNNPSELLMYAMIFFQGVLGYGMSTLFASTAADLFAGKSYGTIFGCLSLAASIGSGGGPWAFGAMYDYFGSYDMAFWSAIVLCLFSVFAMWKAGPRHARKG